MAYGRNGRERAPAARIRTTGAAALAFVVACAGTAGRSDVRAPRLGAATPSRGPGLAPLGWQIPDRRSRTGKRGPPGTLRSLSVLTSKAHLFSKVSV